MGIFGFGRRTTEARRNRARKVSGTQGNRVIIACKNIVKRYLIQLHKQFISPMSLVQFNGYCERGGDSDEALTWGREDLRTTRTAKRRERVVAQDTFDSCTRTRLTLFVFSVLRMCFFLELVVFTRRSEQVQVLLKYIRNLTILRQRNMGCD